MFAGLAISVGLCLQRDIVSFTEHVLCFQLFVIDLIFYNSTMLSWVAKNEKLEIALAYYIYN